MKKMLMLLMFIIVLSGTAFSKTMNIYLVVPDDAMDTTTKEKNVTTTTENLKYYFMDTDGNKIADVEKAELKTNKYEGSSDLNLVKFEIKTNEDIVKMVAGYMGSDGKYYFLTDEDASGSVTAITSVINNASNPLDAVSSLGSYGIKITDNMRLSMIPVNSGVTNTTEFPAGTKMEDIDGVSGISPSSSKEKVFIMINDDAIYYLKKNDELLTEEDLDKVGVPAEYREKFSDAGSRKVAKDLTLYENVSYLNFEMKSYKETQLDTEAYNINETVLSKEDGKIKKLQGVMEKVLIFNEKYEDSGEANGQWSIYIKGKVESSDGETIVLLEDIGTDSSSEIAVGSKVKDKSRARETDIKTSLIDSESFVIENIKE